MSSASDAGRQMIAVCSSCHRRREENGGWCRCGEEVSDPGVLLTHGLCPDCLQRLYPEFATSVANGF
jgi:hypothetical protein